MNPRALTRLVLPDALGPKRQALLRALGASAMPVSRDNDMFRAAPVPATIEKVWRSATDLKFATENSSSIVHPY